MEKFEELEKLQNLKSRGTITEEEFEIQKHKILNNTNDSIKKENKKSTIIRIVASIIIMIGGTLAIMDSIFGLF